MCQCTQEIAQCCSKNKQEYNCTLQAICVLIHVLSFFLGSFYICIIKDNISSSKSKNAKNQGYDSKKYKSNQIKNTHNHTSIFIIAYAKQKVNPAV